MSIQIQSALGILSSDVPTGNVLWVDAVNGVDKLARRGRMTIPFRTLTAAKEAAREAEGGQPGDTIIVLPGNYVDADLAKDGVNWHFMNGAKVTHPILTLFSVLLPMTFSVTGEGVFEAIGGGVLDIGDAGAEISFKCKSMSSSDGFPIYVSSGLRVVIEVDSLSAASGPGVYVSGGNCTLHARILECDGASCIYLSGGIVEIDAYRIESDGGSAIYLSGSATARVRAFEIISSVAPAVTYDSSERLTIQNARLVSTWEHVDGRAVYAAGGSSGITLHSCVLIADVDATDSINALSEDFLVQIHGACTANKPKGSNVITTPIPQGPNMFSRADSVT